MASSAPPSSSQLAAEIDAVCAAAAGSPALLPLLRRHVSTRRAFVAGDFLVDHADLGAYVRSRKQWLKERTQLTAVRRVEVGPFASLTFENYDLLWIQIHEMLRIEKGGSAQLAEEFAAYEPLLPNSSSLVATLMFEISDKIKRERWLKKLSYAEDTVFLDVDGTRVVGKPCRDELERTLPDGRTSAVHFLRFELPEPLRLAVAGGKASRGVAGLAHEAYGHQAVLGAPLFAAWQHDLTCDR